MNNLYMQNRKRYCKTNSYLYILRFFELRSGPAIYFIFRGGVVYGVDDAADGAERVAPVDGCVAQEGDKGC